MPYQLSKKLGIWRRAAFTRDKACNTTRLEAAIVCLTLAHVPQTAWADLYSYTNDNGEYVISQKPPKNKDIQYAVLTDEGEFIRMVEGRNQQIPITHWRPWFIPREDEPWEGNPNPAIPREREGVVTVDEEGSAEQ